MKTTFKDLFEYNAQVNQKLSEAFIEQPTLVSGRAHQLFSHVLNAHHIWNCRIMAKPEMYTVWEIQPVEKFHPISSQNNVDTINILDHLDINAIVSYQNSTGERFQNTVGEVLFHVINHSTYHRGQIAIDFKENGISPLITDYIFWKRKSI